ncbi:MAG: hypothetical protein NTV93_13715 [Verrucomicrobia bacterium]|nr:hypothetical protein [Verrucomicrobiota bacterium]
MKNTESDWMRIIARDRLNLERQAAEDRRNETVARLAIELGRAKIGRPKKGCAAEIVPDVNAAARLLTDAAAARRRERERPERELKDMAVSLMKESDQRSNPPLLWHEAKRGAAEGSGGVLNCSVLFDAGAGADRHLHVGRFHVEELPSGGDRSKWVQLGKWEVMRDAKRFRGLVLDALNIIWSNKMRMNPKGKMPIVTDADVSKVLKNALLSEMFFRALLQSRKESAKLMDKGSAGEVANPPRGKRARV